MTTPYVTVTVDAAYPAGTGIAAPASGSTFTKWVAASNGHQLMGTLPFGSAAAGPATMQLLGQGGPQKFLLAEAVTDLVGPLTVTADGEVEVDGSGEIVGMPLETGAIGAVIDGHAKLVEAAA